MTSQFSQVAICTRHGNARDVIEVKAQEIPNPGPGFVRVRMLAAPINPSDILYCKGNYGIGPEPPMPVGLEGVGVVEQSGGGLLGRLRKGKRVAVVSRTGGTWGEYCVTQAETVIPVPASLSVEQAASFFINPASALMMTRWIFDIPTGGWLLQSAANSALGRMVIRLGQHFGFRTLNVVRNPQHVEPLRQLGGNAVIVANEETPLSEFKQQVFQHCLGTLPLFAIDPVGGKLGGLLMESLGSGGRMLCYASLAGEPMPVDSRAMITQDRQLKSFWLGREVQALSLVRKLKLIRQLGQLHQKGLFQVETFTSFPLQNISEALATAESNSGAHKVILKM